MANYTGVLRHGLHTVCAALMLVAGYAAAQNENALPGIREDAPLSYTVKKGDTLWDISSYFLKDPFLWPELWSANPEIENPHLIYPGETLYLVYKDGRPMLTRTPPFAGTTDRRQPRIRAEPRGRAIPAIPLELIRAFLNGPRVVDEETLKRAPYVLDFVDEHIVGGAGDAFYAKHPQRQADELYRVVNLGKVYQDPDTKKDIGQEVVPVAVARIERENEEDLTTMLPLQSSREVRKGDRLLPVEQDPPPATFYPHPPSTEIQARIVSIFDGLVQTGRYQIVTLNRGSKDGLEIGHVLDIYNKSRTTPDPFAKPGFRRDGVGPRAPCCQPRESSIPLVLPQERAGYVMVFKAYPTISYALVMEARRPVRMADFARTPRRSDS